jgi:polyphosphate glucokinase
MSVRRVIPLKSTVMDANEKLRQSRQLPPEKARKVLVIDIGGSHIKVYAKGRHQPIKIDSGPAMTPKHMMEAVRAAVDGWKYDVVSLGYPGPVVHGKPLHNPVNLGPGWVGFDFQNAFGRPTKMINDAAMQALGSYRGERMLFLGLGTGLGSALIVDGVLEPMELAHLPYKHGKTYEDYIGDAALKRRGKKKWIQSVFDVVAKLKSALQADYVVLGGGNAKRLTTLPSNTFRGNNENARTGGVRLWNPSMRGLQATISRAN